MSARDHHLLRPSPTQPAAEGGPAAVPIRVAEGEAPTAPLAGSLALRLAALLPASSFAAIALAPPMNHDVAAVLSFSQRWLAGERLYADLLDVNPPLIFLLSLVPAAVGAWTPLGAVPALLLCVLALCALASWMALRLARGHTGGGPVEAACLGVALPLTTLAAGYDFGQREHLMAVAALPYLILAARRAEGEPTEPSLALGAAALAALGFALKPHFLAIPALVETVVLARRRRVRHVSRAPRDPVPWAMAAVWMAYLGVVLLAFPDYLGHALPLAWGGYRALGDLTWWQAILTERLGTALAVLLPLGVVALRGGGAPGWALPQVLAAAGFGAAFAAVVQHKGWTYHALPVRLLAVALAARWLDRTLAAPPRAAAEQAARGAAAAAAFVLGILHLTGAEAPWREITWS